MSKRIPLVSTLIVGALLVISCSKLPELPTRTPPAEEVEVIVEEATAEPDKPPPGPSGLAPEIIVATMDPGAAAKAVDLIGAWVEAGIPEVEPFDYTGRDGDTYQGYFAVDILPLFTKTGIWFEGSRACDSCHFANSAASAHEMDLSSYAGILAGADALEEPPGVSILG
jgi:hypothetical protein